MGICQVRRSNEPLTDHQQHVCNFELAYHLEHYLHDVENKPVLDGFQNKIEAKFQGRSLKAQS